MRRGRCRTASFQRTSREIDINLVMLVGGTAENVWEGGKREGQ